MVREGLRPSEWGFWHFQLVGWAAFSLFSFPLKWVILEDVPGSVIVSLYRDGLGFLLTLGMREIYRNPYWLRLQPAIIAGLVLMVSLIGGTILTLFTLAFHSTFDFEEERIFKTSVVFAIFYFRTGLCLAWSGLYFTFKLIRDRAEHKIQLVRAERDLARAETRLLRAQMDPHFLYNALNTVLAGVEKSNDHQKALVRSLSQFLRYSLETRNDELVALGKEFDAIAGYLAVEKARFGEKLEVTCHIDQAARDVLVPGILIQPLVENAMKYGRQTSPRPRKVSVVVSQSNGEGLRIAVSNTGKWVERDVTDTIGGIGLENLKARLRLLHPGPHQLDISSENGWVTVTLIITTEP
jgi:sensor histidine kinase YesM